MVLSIVHTHEEKLSGMGFPRGVKKLSPAEEIVSLCSSYDRLVTCLDGDPKENFKAMVNKNAEILITGGAGFIGYHVANFYLNKE